MDQTGIQPADPRLDLDTFAMSQQHGVPTRHGRRCAGPRLLALGGLDAFARGGLQDLLIE